MECAAGHRGLSVPGSLLLQSLPFDGYVLILLEKSRMMHQLLRMDRTKAGSSRLHRLNKRMKQPLVEPSQGVT